MADLTELVARAIREDDGSPCISSTRNMCRRKDGCICLSLAAAVLAALREAGYAVVPREATEAMCQSGDNNPETIDWWDYDSAALAWEVMIAEAEKETGK